jgi:hypothetical protein
MLHSIKDALFHGEKHIDLDHEMMLTKFTTLNETLIQIKQHVSSFTANLNGLLNASHATAVNFGLLLEDSSADTGGTPNSYQSLVSQWRTAHQKLNAEQEPIANDLASKVLKPVDEYLVTFGPIHARIAKRNELHKRLEYYLNKMTTLTTDRDERLMHGIVEKTKTTDTIERNRQKLEAISTEYQQFASRLMADLQNAWAGRVHVLGPAMAAFIQVEKRFTHLCDTYFSDVCMVEILMTPPSSAHVTFISAHDVPGPESTGALQRPMLPAGGFISEQNNETAKSTAKTDERVPVELPASTVPTKPRPTTSAAAADVAAPLLLPARSVATVRLTTAQKKALRRNETPLLLAATSKGQRDVKKTNTGGTAAAGNINNPPSQPHHDEGSSSANGIQGQLGTVSTVIGGNTTADIRTPPTSEPVPNVVRRVKGSHWTTRECEEKNKQSPCTSKEPWEEDEKWRTAASSAE